MAGDMIECPNCHRMIRDTGGPFIICRFCGHKIMRADIEKKNAEVEQKKMIVNLQGEVDKYKKLKNISFLVGGVSLLASFVILAAVSYKNIPLIAGTMGISAVWLAMGGMYSKKFETQRSKLFDLVGHSDFY